jgi:hypothetical protein
VVLGLASVGETTIGGKFRSLLDAFCARANSVPADRLVDTSAITNKRSRIGPALLRLVPKAHSSRFRVSARGNVKAPSVAIQHKKIPGGSG